MNMIVANITSFDGQDMEAEHFYCTYDETEYKTPTIYTMIGRKYELKRVLTDQSEVDYLNKKDTSNCWHVGLTTNRFKSIKSIHIALKNLFKNKIIVTYYKGKIFKEMLYFKDGKNLGYKVFGEVFTHVPNGVFKHLLPTYDKIKIKCEDCGKEHKFEDIISEQSYGDKTIINFLNKWDVDEPCCEYFNLLWNVIL